MRFSALLVFACVACSLGHNFLTAPKSRGNNNTGGNTQSPCDPANTGAGGYTAGTSQFTKFVGESITLGFSQNHAGGDQYVTIASYSAGDTNFAANNYVAQQSWPRNQGDGQGPSGGTINAPNNPGLNTLQWKWDGWYDCVDFTILANPPEGATVTDNDNNGDWTDANDMGYVYATADGSGLFNAYTGETVCLDGYIADGTGCKKVNTNKGVLYVTVTLNFGSDNYDEASYSSDDWNTNWIAAVADALDCDPSQIEITYFSEDTETSTMTMAFYDGDDSSALDLYTEFSLQYNDDNSQLNTDSLTAWIDTTSPLEVDDSDPYDDSASTLSVTVAAGVVVAGLLL